MAVVTEAVGDLINTIRKSTHTGAVGDRIAGIAGTADTYRFAQIVCLFLYAFQLDTGNGDGMSVRRIAIRELCIPGRTAEDADTDAGKLTVNQILFCIQLDCLLFACLKDNFIGINLMGVALEVIGIETHLNIIGPVAAQSIDLHIQYNIGFLLCLTGFGFLSQGNLVAVVAEAIGDLIDAIDESTHAGAVGLGIAGIDSAAGHGGLTQIVCLFRSAFQLDTGNCDDMSVRRIAIREFCIPGRTAEDADTDAIQLAVDQIFAGIEPNRLFLACF